MGDAPLFGLCMIAVAWLAWWVSQKPPRSNKTRQDDRPWTMIRRSAPWSPFEMREPAPPAEPGAAEPMPAIAGSRRRTAGQTRPHATGRSSRAARG